MTAKIIDGKKIAATMREKLCDTIRTLEEQCITPGLGVLLVGDDPASKSYVTAKEKACNKTGIFSTETHLPRSATLKEILEVIHSYNHDSRIHGILLQLPLPKTEMQEAALNAINSSKDVDGFHPTNIGRMMLGIDTFIPCTPLGILQLLKHAEISVQGAHIVIIGRSTIVGRPLANLLSQKSDLGNGTVTLCHTGTPDISVYTKQADIIISAAGRPNTITADIIKEGVAVIDVGINRVKANNQHKGYRLVGDVDFENVREKASAITPVPGGVGPMTITMLLYNTVKAARLLSTLHT